VLGRTFDFVGALQGAQQGLGVEELLQAAAQQWPVILGNGEVSSQVEYGDLTYLTRNALATNQAKGEIAFACGFVIGAGLTNEHVCHAIGKTGKKPKHPKYYGTTKCKIKSRKSESYINQRVT
jgi:hypothetical protein